LTNKDFILSTLSSAKHLAIAIDQWNADVSKIIGRTPNTEFKDNSQLIKALDTSINLMEELN
jgi:hypothetical protein